MKPWPDGQWFYWQRGASPFSGLVGFIYLICFCGLKQKLNTCKATTVVRFSVEVLLLYYISACVTFLCPRLWSLITQVTWNAQKTTLTKAMCVWFPRRKCASSRWLVWETAGVGGRSAGSSIRRADVQHNLQGQENFQTGLSHQCQQSGWIHLFIGKKKRNSCCEHEVI